MRQLVGEDEIEHRRAQLTPSVDALRRIAKGAVEERVHQRQLALERVAQTGLNVGNAEHEVQEDVVGVSMCLNGGVRCSIRCGCVDQVVALSVLAHAIDDLEFVLQDFEVGKHSHGSVRVGVECDLTLRGLIFGELNELLLL